MSHTIQKIRQKVMTGTKWEEAAGFSRALRVGNQILVAGTTATDTDGIVGKNDAAKQMYFILERIEAAIHELGGTLQDVVRTRIYLSDIRNWEAVSKIHKEKFKEILPVCTLVEVSLVGDCLVEVEAEAVLN